MSLLWYNVYFNFISKISLVVVVMTKHINIYVTVFYSPLTPNFVTSGTTHVSHIIHFFIVVIVLKSQRIAY